MQNYEVTLFGSTLLIMIAVALAISKLENVLSQFVLGLGVTTFLFYFNVEENPDLFLNKYFHNHHFIAKGFEILKELEHCPNSLKELFSDYSFGFEIEEGFVASSPKPTESIISGIFPTAHNKDKLGAVVKAGAKEGEKILIKHGPTTIAVRSNSSVAATAGPLFTSYSFGAGLRNEALFSNGRPFHFKITPNPIVSKIITRGICTASRSHPHSESYFSLKTASVLSENNTVENKNLVERWRRYSSQPTSKKSLYTVIDVSNNNLLLEFSRRITTTVKAQTVAELITRKRMLGDTQPVEATKHKYLKSRTNASLPTCLLTQ